MVDAKRRTWPPMIRRTPGDALIYKHMRLFSEPLQRVELVSVNTA
jgi:hypothetical protein